MIPLRAKWRVDALQAHLSKRIAELRPLVVADITRAILAVSTFPCERSLYSLEFAFDEDDGRAAHFEVQFADWDAKNPAADGLSGYEVFVYLPRVLTPPPGSANRAAAAAPSPGDADLPARFVRYLADLGAYKTIEPLEAVSADVYLL